MSGERRRAIEARVAAAAARLEKEGRYTATRRCIQHGKVSVYAHCVSVADTACVLAETLHLRVNERALIRGALLHDYFLYDWHDKANGHHWHGFTHPGTALHNASEDWKLTPVEREIIKKSGAWYYYNDQRIGQGRENARLYVKEHPELIDLIEEQIRDEFAAGRISVDEEAGDEDEIDMEPEDSQE